MRRGVLLLLLACCVPPAPCAAELRRIVTDLAALGDRSTGSAGCRAAADYISERLEAIGFAKPGRHRFSLPALQVIQSRLLLPATGDQLRLLPLRGNLVSPGSLPAAGLIGPLIYVGDGEPARFNGLALQGAVVLMDIDSGSNWLHAANLGAAALIYLDPGGSARDVFRDKLELSPIDFPRFWLPAAEAEAVLGQLTGRVGRELVPQVHLAAEIRWEESEAENIWSLVPGTEPLLQERLVIVEAFYDSSAWVAGAAPGADEASAVATLLELGRHLRAHPPGRSILLVASAGHGQSLAGMRELVWSLHSRSKDLRDLKKRLQATAENATSALAALEPLAARASPDDLSPALSLGAGREALLERIKTEADRVSRELMRIRLGAAADGAADSDRIQELARQRMLLRRLSWHSADGALSPREARLLLALVPSALEEQRALRNDALRQIACLQSAATFRERVKAFELDAVVSLHLSSHGDGLGAFNQGWFYPLKPSPALAATYGVLAETLEAVAAKSGPSAAPFLETLRPDRQRPWKSYLPDRPPLGGEVAALAGLLGVSLVTTHDARPLWGTPGDQPEAVNWSMAEAQRDRICQLVTGLSQAPQLQGESLPPDGFATLSGRARFLRHGELFADQPAPESVILAFQGETRQLSQVDTMGYFTFKGLAHKSRSLNKVIIEGYRFDPGSGAVRWAIDKRLTGKDAYRVKMQHSHMETDLVMFGCRQSTLFGLLEPRNFHPMTALQLIDGRTEAAPSRYWYSRIDTRASTIASLFLEPGTRFKLTQSDTMLSKKLILLDADATRPEGRGYRVDQWPRLWGTELRAARDMWALLKPRIDKLERHGVFNAKIRALEQEGIGALDQAQRAMAERTWDRFLEASRRSWALASRVYADVERTQKDILFGVLFYIALFAPFSFCLERVLFGYTGIYRRLAAFATILILLIALIYNVHPAFQLAFSPLVVILAFFIMGLSLVVTLILFLRFEGEMELLQRRSRHQRVNEVSHFKAFTAAFFLGVSNLRRRPLRTLLTCTTLVILTFTIMSFTTVKSVRQHAQLRLSPQAPYRGVMLKVANWQDLPTASLEAITTAFGTSVGPRSDSNVRVAPRVWLEAEDRTQSLRVPLRHAARGADARALVGLSVEEAAVSGIEHALLGGRWLMAADRQAILLPDTLALQLGVEPQHPSGSRVLIWGMAFEVVGVFSAGRMQQITDLDGETLTPVTFPSEVTMELTEVEMEALESGEDVRAFQSRYQHAPWEGTVILPYRTLLSAGGALKSVAVGGSPERFTRAAVQAMGDRFGLSLFSGEDDGTYLYNASDAISYSGLPHIIVPLLIATLIVLNTMIGSVYERRREIAIYTSVGLAPSHVAFLFVAEALALAVLSTVIGYLLAQSAAALLGGTALWQGITVNYSSLAGVAAMGLVILVVLASVLYPAQVASRIAIPDVHRTWTLPPAREDRLEVSLPFLMRYRERLSIGGFLHAYLLAHQGVSHGAFSTAEVALFQGCDEKERPNAGSGADGSICGLGSCLEISARVWLAPFDFGIMQTVRFSFCAAAEEPGYLEIRGTIRRQAGETNLWRRANRTLLLELRRQLLLWRSLDEETQGRYAADFEIAVAADAGSARVEA